VLAYLWEQADAIRAADPQIRRDAPDSVHRIRVACRRMRSTLQSFQALLDRDRTDGLVAELRWLAGELGGARDLEVQEQRIGRAVATLPPEIALGPVAAETTRFFARRRADAASTATAALDGDRYLALLDAVDALLADPPLTDAAVDRAQTELPTLVAKALRRTRPRRNWIRRPRRPRRDGGDCCSLGRRVARTGRSPPYCAPLPTAATQRTTGNTTTADTTHSTGRDRMAHSPSPTASPTTNAPPATRSWTAAPGCAPPVTRSASSPRSYPAPRPRTPRQDAADRHRRRPGPSFATGPGP